MNDIVGIDLGTTNSLIGVMEAGFAILLADPNGERLTPSVVHFPAQGDVLVGAPAARVRAIRPHDTIYSAKRFIGRRSEEITAKDLDVAYSVVRRSGKAVQIRAGEQAFLPEQISAHVLAKLKHDAELALGKTISRAVITVPAYFNDGQRSATKRAGELAGLIVERIVNEPTAAALAYGLDKSKERSKIAVYDFGGGTFDVSILELNDGVFEVLATNGNTRLGGDDIDAGLIANCQLPIPDWEKRDVVVKAKHLLSTETDARIELPFVGVYDLSREGLEQIARPIVERTRAHCLRVLSDAKLSADDLDDVILVGGVTRMPIVRRLVREIFGREPNVSQNPDEAVAIGATIQAGILSGAVSDVVLLDVTPLSLGIETFGGLMNVIIPRNSTIPTKAGEMFTTAVHNQTAMQIRVLQGEREMARDNWPLGQFEIEFERAPKGVARVGVQFAIDANGILCVLARDTKTGAEKVLELKSAVDVTDEAVEAMLSDSLDHAFEDMSERIWTETRLKSEELLRAVDSAMNLAGDEIPTGERVIILQCASAVRHALASRETKRLKEANDALDSATQTLAALIVEKAMADAAKQEK
jgi:molecular chaperone DnaK